MTVASATVGLKAVMAMAMAISKSLPKGPRQNARYQRDTEIQEHTLSDYLNIEMDIAQQKFRVDRNKQHLNDGIHCNEYDRKGHVALSKIGKDNDHCYTGRKPVQNKSGREVRLAAQKKFCEQQLLSSESPCHDPSHPK